MATAARSRAQSLISKPFLSSLFAPRTTLLRRCPLAVALSSVAPIIPVAGAGGPRRFSTRPTSSSLNDPSPNWSNRPPKETILLDGCDFEHWLVVMEPPEGTPTRDDIIDSYIKTLAQVVGSEDEARMKIYSVSTKHYFAFGALVSEELSYEIKKLPKVRWVLPDSYLDVKNKDYGGEPFINGQAVPYDPKYHEEWVRNNARANERSRRNDRPRNFDRSRNFERRRENMQNRDFQNTAPLPPFPQSPGPSSNSPPMPNAQTAPPMTNAQAAPPMPNAQTAPRPPFSQNPGPGTSGFQNQGMHPPNSNIPNSGFQNQGMPPPMTNAQAAPPMPNAQTAPRPPFSQNPGPGTSGFQNQGMHPPNSNVPNSGFQNQGMPPPNSSIPNSGFQNPPGGGLGGPNYQNHVNSGYPNHGAYQNQGGYPNQDPGYQNQGRGSGFQNQGNFPYQGNYQNPGPYPNQGAGGPPPNSRFQNSYASNRDMGGNPNANAYQGQDLPERAAPTMPGRDN